ncbi:MAG: hypothetical protein ACI4V3_00820 [Faecousia sp.]
MGAITVKILSESERSTVREALFREGAAACEQDPKAAAYLAEYYGERGLPLRAYGYLLQAAHRKLAVSSDALTAYANEAKSLSDDEVRMDYEGALMVGKELRQTNFRDAAYYLCIAANSVSDKYGVAALLAADLLSSDLRFKAQSEKYYALAAQKGNPDLPPFRQDNASGFHRAGNGEDAFFAAGIL